MTIRYLGEAVIWLALCAASLIASASAEAGYANPHLLTSVEALAARSAATAAESQSTPGSDTVIVDVRPAEAFAKGHMPGARHLDPDALSNPDSSIAGALRSDADLSAIFRGLGISAGTSVVLYDDKGGFHAARVFWALEYLGHRRVSIVDGGIQKWVARGFALETGDAAESPARKPGRFTPTMMPRRYASADWILDRRSDPGTVVIDVRPPAAFAKGHIPWARNIPWKGNLAPDNTMKQADALQAHFAAHNVTPDSNVVVHCQSGKASAHSYFALRLLGYPRVRTYHRSWSEWGSADDLPKAVTTGG